MGSEVEEEAAEEEFDASSERVSVLVVEGVNYRSKAHSSVSSSNRSHPGVYQVKP